jgi:cation transporter-like permease
VALLLGDDDWRANPAKLRVAAIATVLWTALSALRLAVQLPLYLAGATEALAATKLVMGVPLYAALLWVTWLLVRTAWRARERPDDGV